MKKALAGFMCVAVMLSLMACGDGKGKPGDDDDSMPKDPIAGTWEYISDDGIVSLVLKSDKKFTMAIAYDHDHDEDEGGVDHTHGHEDPTEISGTYTIDGNKVTLTADDEDESLVLIFDGVYLSDEREFVLFRKVR